MVSLKESNLLNFVFLAITFFKKKLVGGNTRCWALGRLWNPSTLFFLFFLFKKKPYVVRRDVQN